MCSILYLKLAFLYFWQNKIDTKLLIWLLMCLSPFADKIRPKIKLSRCNQTVMGKIDFNQFLKKITILRFTTNIEDNGKCLLEEHMTATLEILFNCYNLS
jgi:hypothetical protein